MGEGKGGGRRGSRSNGKVVAEGRELELVGGLCTTLVNEAGGQKSTGAAISRRGACRVVGGAATKPESTEGHRRTA